MKTENMSEPYSGTFMRAIDASVDKVMAGFEFHEADCNPSVYLERVLGHIADSIGPDERMGNASIGGDVQAWFLTREVYWCLLYKTTTLCLRCRQMEGMHSSGWCPNDTRDPQHRGTFLSMEMTYRTALGGYSCPNEMQGDC